MKLDVKAMVLTIGLLWGAAMFLTGTANLVWDGYGEDFLDVMASVYPEAGISTEQQLTVALGLQTPVCEPVSRLQSG